MAPNANRVAELEEWLVLELEPDDSVFRVGFDFACFEKDFEVFVGEVCD
jgi:hypothetical protein